MRYWNGVIGGFGGAIISMWVSNREYSMIVGAMLGVALMYYVNSED